MVVNVHLTLLLANVAATWLMVGVIWVVQLVHYPMFSMVDRARFVAFHRYHSARITFIVFPAMVIELGTALVIAYRLGSVLAWVGFGCAALTWLVTAGLSVPAHERLGNVFDAAAHRRLVASNWLRTVAFTAHGVVTLALVVAG